MDGVFTWDYYSLINELTQGMEHTKQLRTYLSSVASTSEAIPELLLQKIHSSYEQSLLILKWNGSPVQSLRAAGAIESMVSGDGSTRSDDKKRSFENHQKLMHISKRSKKSQFTVQERVSNKNGFEGSLDDGYSWRKYGQKDILGAKFPRGYYRCTFRFIQNCYATKQMQKSDVDPTVIEITYRGYHTCQFHQVTNSTVQAKSPEKQASHHSLIDGDYSPYFVSAEDGFDSFEGPIDDGYSWRKFGQKDILGAKYPSKKSQFTEQERVSTENGFEGSLDDGYSWRKYGQKDILGAKFPRSYYRCTYRNMKNCRATKQVQRSDDDPTVFEIIYRGSHNCHLATNSALQATSPEKEASHHSLIVCGYSSSFVSPTTPESNYFSVSSCQMNGLGIVHNLDHSESYLSDIGIFRDLHHSDSDRTDTFSADTSTTSSSIGGEFARLSGARPDFSIWGKMTSTDRSYTPQKDDKDK